MKFVVHFVMQLFVGIGFLAIAVCNAFSFVCGAFQHIFRRVRLFPGADLHAEFTSCVMAMTFNAMFSSCSWSTSYDAKLFFPSLVPLSLSFCGSVLRLLVPVVASVVLSLVLSRFSTEVFGWPGVCVCVAVSLSLYIYIYLSLFVLFRPRAARCSIIHWVCGDVYTESDN